ncbi:MAG: hypothetical protein ACFB00_00480 [Parvularculaceae bacterium]
MTDVLTRADAATSAAPTIERVEGKAGVKEFIRADRAAYAGDPHYIAPLAFELAARLDPRANPGLDGAEIAFFVARRDGAAVGRVAAIVNPAHLARHNDATGHFGFLDAVDDADAFAALLGAAETWLRERGMARIAGPFSLSVNEECGLLIDGFDTPPYVMMPHGRPWYKTRVEALGYRKAHDMHALLYRNERDFIPERRRKFVGRALASDRIRIRNIDFKTFAADIAACVDIFNDAWSENWGFTPLSDAQAAHMAKELRPIIEKHNVVICEYDGAPAAFGIVLPNVYEAIRDFDGQLLPFNWAKLIWRLKVKRLATARMPLMGVRKKLQGKPVGAAFAYKIIDMVNSANIDRGLQASELSWILESNKAMLNMLTEMGGRVYKTYRIYEKAL